MSHALAVAFAVARDRHADRAFVVEEAAVSSYREIGAQADGVAAALSALGLAGRPVAVHLATSAAYVASFLGAAIAGSTVVPIDPRLTPREVDRLVGHAGCAGIIEREGARPLEGAPAPARGAGDATVVLYTSGSTAGPKGVVLAPRAILDNATAWCDRYALLPDDGFLCALSLGHSFGITAALVAALLVGARIILPADPLPARMAELSARHRATVVLATAAVYPWLARSNGCPGSSFPEVRLFLSGACTLPADAARAFATKLGRPIHQTYGLTEAGPVVTAMPLADVRPGTVGVPLDRVEVRIVDDELQVRGPSVMRGYLGDAAATAAAIDAEGWLATGDLARIDDAGFVTILGRRKDLIVRAGSKIYPEELEEALREHADVGDAAVVGAPHDAYEEVPVAFVVAREGKALDPAALLGFCRERLAAYKVPRAIRILGALPRNANGKVLKRELRALAALAAAAPPGDPLP